MKQSDIATDGQSVSLGVETYLGTMLKHYLQLGSFDLVHVRRPL
jgi:hypothetical protein